MSARSGGAALEGAQEERRGDGRLQALGLVVSPGTHDVSEWNHLKFIVHLFPVLMQRCLGCLQDVNRCCWIGLDRCGRDVTIRCGCTFGYGVAIRFNEILGFTLHPTSSI